ncbi:MAG: hypothetical protein AAFX40_15610, partial [Cyanobacteria bacterium J06639_1]
MTQKLLDRDRPESPLHRGHLFWRLLDRTQLHARIALQLATAYLELGHFAFERGKAGLSSGVEAIRTARSYLATAVHFYSVHLSLCDEIPAPPPPKTSKRDRARAQSLRQQNQRLRRAGLSSVLLHGLMLGMGAIAVYLIPPLPPEEDFIPFEFVELPPEKLEVPDPFAEEILEELPPPDPLLEPPPPLNRAEPIPQAEAPPPAAPPPPPRVAPPPVAAAPPPPPRAAANPPPPAPPVRQVPIAPPPPPRAVNPPLPPARDVPPEPPPPPREPERTTLAEAEIALSTPPPIQSTPTPRPQLEPLLESFRTDAPPQLLDLPLREPAPESEALSDTSVEPEAPAPVESSAPQLDPLLDSFRSEEPPQLLELPARSPVSEPEAVPQPDPPPVAAPEPIRRPPPPLAVLPSTPEPVTAPIESAGADIQTETEVVDA